MSNGGEVVEWNYHLHLHMCCAQTAERCVHSGHVSNLTNKACHLRGLAAGSLCLRPTRWQVFLWAEAILHLLTENEPPPAGGVLPPFGSQSGRAHVWPKPGGSPGSTTWRACGSTWELPYLPAQV